MEHFLYDVIDKGDSNNHTDAESIITSYKDIPTPTASECGDKENQRAALVMSYDLNFTSTQLSKILEYYDISIRKMKKMDKCEAIADYEMADENIGTCRKTKAILAMDKRTVRR